MLLIFLDFHSAAPCLRSACREPFARAVLGPGRELGQRSSQTMSLPIFSSGRIGTTEKGPGSNLWLLFARKGPGWICSWPRLIPDLWHAKYEEKSFRVSGGGADASSFFLEPSPTAPGVHHFQRMTQI